MRFSGENTQLKVTGKNKTFNRSTSHNCDSIVGNGDENARAFNKFIRGKVQLISFVFLLKSGLASGLANDSIGIFSEECSAYSL